MVKWYLSGKWLLAAAVMVGLSGCVSSGKPVAWFGKPSKEVADKEAVAKADKNSPSKGDKTKAAGGASKSDHQLASASDADGKDKKTTWLNFNREDDTQASANTKSASRSPGDDKAASPAVASRDVKSSVTKTPAGKDAAVDKTADKAVAAAATGTAKVGPSRTDSSKGTVASVAKPSATSADELTKPKNRPLVSSEEDPFLAEALADISKGNASANKTATKPGDKPVADAAPAASQTTAKTTKPKSQLTGDEEFAAWMAQIDKAGTDKKKPAADGTPAKAAEPTATNETALAKSPTEKAANAAKFDAWMAEPADRPAAGPVANEAQLAAADSADKIVQTSRSTPGLPDWAHADSQSVTAAKAATTDVAKVETKVSLPDRSPAESAREATDDRTPASSGHEADQFAKLRTSDSMPKSAVTWPEAEIAQTETSKSAGPDLGSPATGRRPSDTDRMEWAELGAGSKTSTPRKQPTTTAATTGLVDACTGLTPELKAMVAGLESTDLDTIRRNEHRLGQMGEKAEAATPALQKLLDHSDPYVSTHAALALTRMHQESPKVLQSLVKGLKSDDPGVRSFAAAVIGELGPMGAEALPALAATLNDEDGYVRMHVAEVLVRHDRWAGRSLDVLRDCLSDPDENIRWLATYSLAELAPQRPDIVISLRKLVNDPASRVQIGAVYALGEIGKMASSAIPDLEQIATDPNADLRAAARYALQQVKS